MLHFHISTSAALATWQDSARRPNCRRVHFAASRMTCPRLQFMTQGSAGSLWLGSKTHHYYVIPGVDLILRSHHLWYLICVFGFIINVAMNFRACFHASIAFTEMVLLKSLIACWRAHWLRCWGALVFNLNACLGANFWLRLDAILSIKGEKINLQRSSLCNARGQDADGFLSSLFNIFLL